MTDAVDKSFPLTQIREDTPGVNEVIHFNNCGSALPPTPVLETVINHLKREASIGGYEAADEAQERLNAVYDSTAKLIGSEPDEIAVIENATRAWDMAVYGYKFSPGDRVLLCRAEYVSNVIALLQLKERHQIEIIVIDDDEYGQIDLVHLEQELAKGAEMVTLTHTPTSGGLINPAESVGTLCNAYNTFFVLDACQSIGQIPINVKEIGCQVLSATSRKYLRGPRGVGFLYVEESALDQIEPPFLDLRAATWTSDMGYEIVDGAKRFENWETNFAGKLGLGAAIDYALDLTVEKTSKRLKALAEILRSKLASLNQLSIHDQGQDKGGIVTFSIEGLDSEVVSQKLRAQKINTSTTAPGAARFDLDHRGIPTVVRASTHYYNSEEEIDCFVSAVAALSK
ncbi:aminotransferase class V-fold PLP-dependent enzyme [Acidimicrobiaceae bacterium]|nr:aminotransferase class V-fold PLP-dependent enzyme [Acidimicrobiaceae bacterium]